MKYIFFIILFFTNYSSLAQQRISEGLMHIEWNNGKDLPTVQEAIFYDSCIILKVYYKDSTSSANTEATKLKFLFVDIRKLIFQDYSARNLTAKPLVTYRVTTQDLFMNFHPLLQYYLPPKKYSYTMLSDTIIQAVNYRRLLTTKKEEQCVSISYSRSDSIPAYLSISRIDNVFYPRSVLVFKENYDAFPGGKLLSSIRYRLIRPWLTKDEKQLITRWKQNAQQVTEPNILQYPRDITLPTKN